MRWLRSDALRWLAVVLVLVLAWAGPAAEEAVDPRELAPRLRAGDVATVEARLEALATSEARTREGWLAISRSFFALGNAAAEDPDVGAALEAWLKSDPGAWTAQMIDGFRWVMHGQALRADDRTLEFVQVWMQHDAGLRDRAHDAFARAEELAPRSPEPAAALLSIEIGERMPMQDRVRTLARACTVDRRCETARVVMLTGLEPHLGGNIEALLAFARESAREAPDDPRIGLLVGMAHRKAAIATGRPDDYASRDGVFEEAERSYLAHLATHPDAIRHWNEYALLASWAGRREAARRAFERIGDAYAPAAHRNDFRDFAMRRAWAFEASSAERARVAP